MHVADIIRQVRDGSSELTNDDIRQFVGGLQSGKVSEGQLGAFLMAVRLQGLSASLTAELTLAMRDSGQVIQWPSTDAKIIDKHSTGGVGDKTSLIIAPIVASCGVLVPMISGRGLGQTGGTLDKLESLEGFRVDLSCTELVNQVSKLGLAICAAGVELAPVDAQMYALRDVTATVDSSALVTSSILSKKMAEGIHGLVLDIKVGKGAFMKTLEEAKELANSIITASRFAKIRITCVFTNMDRPLGRTIGNSLEVAEALEVLQGGGSKDLKDLSLVLAREMLKLAGVPTENAEKQLANGSALSKFSEMVQAQGGTGIDLKPLAASTPLLSNVSGYVTEIDALKLGYLAMRLGAGRTLPKDTIDHGVGFKLHVQVGDSVESGSKLIEIFHRKSLSQEFCKETLLAFSISDEPCNIDPLILDIWDSS